MGFGKSSKSVEEVLLAKLLQEIFSLQLIKVDFVRHNGRRPKSSETALMPYANQLFLI
jgi:hypothetical protein